MTTTTMTTMRRRSRRSSLASRVVWTVLACTAWSYSSPLPIWAAAAASSEESEILGTRQGNLDYMDAATVKYYLTAPKLDYNVAIMFYAQWCRNCHALAPTWDTIGRHLSAGTTESKLVLGLFDCEHDYEHMEVCSAAGITHYPTLQYFSLAGQEYSFGPKSVPKHTNMFAGNWQYGDAVLDWLTVNTAMSAWHRAGWGKRLRQLLTGRKPDGNGSGSARQALPVGVPGGAAGAGAGSASSLSSSSTATAGTGTSAGAGTATAASTKLLDSKVAELEKDKKELTDIAMRSTIVVDSLLFPVAMDGPDAATYAIAMTGTTDTNSTDKTYTDLFKYLNATGGWTATADPQKEIVRTCVMEVGLDYCQRLQTHQVHLWINTFGDIDDITDADVEKYQATQEEQIAAAEPYCAVMEECVVTEMKDVEVCRPPVCPFVDDAACRYLTACLTEQLQTEYAIAMGLLDGPGSSSSGGAAGAGASTASTGASSGDPAASAGWGV